MKAVHLSISSRYGAGIAAGRTIEALRRNGTDAELWTTDGIGAARGLRARLWASLRTSMDFAPLHCYRRRQLYSVWSNGWLPSNMAPRILAARPDIVHLHWIGDGFLHLGELTRLSAPVVWTMHDAWAFTGGCHYPADCVRFRGGCGCCPQLRSTKANDISARNFRAKCRNASSISRWIAPSDWMGGLAAGSGAMDGARLCVIPNGFDEEVFTPAEGGAMRMRLSLPDRSIVVVAGAADLRERRKGITLVPEAVRQLQAVTGRHCLLLVFGAHADELARTSVVDCRSMGALHSEKEIAAVLAAADMVLVPSLQDNLPNVAVEALACGSPVIGFDSGGIREIVEPGVTGALSGEVGVAGLANAMGNWLGRAPARAEVAACCRARFEERFTYAIHARRIRDMYDEILATTP